MREKVPKSVASYGLILFHQIGSVHQVVVKKKLETTT